MSTSPIQLVNQILFGMVSCGVLSEVRVEEERGPAYQPGLDPRRISVKYVIDALDHHGSEDISTARSEEGGAERNRSSSLFTTTAGKRNVFT